MGGAMAGKKMKGKQNILVMTKMRFACILFAALFVFVSISHLLPERASLTEMCAKQCIGEHQTYRLEGRGAITTKGRYLEYECICLSGS